MVILKICKCSWGGDQNELILFVGISCVQFDDTRIASGSYDKTIRVWDIHSGDCDVVLTLAGHSGTVRCLNLNGNRLVSGSVDRSIKVCLTSVIPGHPFDLRSDQHLISHYNITPESHIKVIGIKEMITNQKGFWLLNKFSLSAPQDAMEIDMENMHTDVRVLTF